MRHPFAERILTALRRNNFDLSLHSEIRMTQRNVQRADIVECAKNAKRFSFDSLKETLRVEGHDLDGDELTIIAGYDHRAVVVTVF